MNTIGSNNRNLLGKTGLVEFRKPSQMRQQVVQLRDSRVYMHPWLYENWYSAGITKIGYPSTEKPSESDKPVMVGIISNWVNEQPGLRKRT